MDTSQKNNNDIVTITFNVSKQLNKNDSVFCCGCGKTLYCRAQKNTIEYQCAYCDTDYSIKVYECIKDVDMDTSRVTKYSKIKQ